MSTPVTEQEVAEWTRGIIAELTARGWTAVQIEVEVGTATGKNCRDILRRLRDSGALPPPQSEAVNAGAQAQAQGVKGVTQSPPASVEAKPERVNREPIGETVDVAGPVSQRDGSGDAASEDGAIGQSSQIGELSRRKPAKRRRWTGLNSVQIRVRVGGELGDVLLAMPPKARARAVAHLLAANANGVDLVALGAPELRQELARANANVNQALRHFHFGEGDADLVAQLRELVALFERLQRAGAMST